MQSKELIYKKVLVNLHTVIFLKKQFGNISTLRRFNPAWFGAYPTWLEYSIAKDAAFCLYCYLFKSKGGIDLFVGEGFSNWKKK